MIASSAQRTQAQSAELPGIPVPRLPPRNRRQRAWDAIFGDPGATLRMAAVRRHRTAAMLRSGSLFVAVVAALSGVGYFLADAGNGPALLALGAIQAVGAVLVRRGVAGPLRRRASELAFVFALWALLVPVASVAADPERTLLAGASLSLIPGAVALLIPWPARTFGTWVTAYLVIVGLCVWALVIRGALGSSQALELGAAVAIGAGIGILGNRLSNEGLWQASRRDDLQRALALRAREHREALSALNEELHRSARTDPLTGAGNRLRLQEDLDTLADRRARYGDHFGIALLDLDRFKLYNDRYGHLAGDEALVDVVRSLRSGARASDAIYRFGGEELVVIMPAQRRRGAVALVERLRRSIEAKQWQHEDNLPWGVITVSAGIVIVDGHSPGSSQAWLRHADQALYDAKLGGRNRTVVDGAADRRSASSPQSPPSRGGSS